MLYLLLIFLGLAGLIVLSIFGIGENQIFGVRGIRQGLDLQGGVSILYEADIPNPTADDMNAASSLLRNRLDARGYTEADAMQEGNRQIRVNIPGVDDPEAAIAQIGQTARLTFQDSNGNVLLTGANVNRASAMLQQTQHGGVGQWVVALSFDSVGTQLFAQATQNNLFQVISIYMDDELLSAATVQNVISDGEAVISGAFTREDANELATLIRQGSLPFGLSVVSFNLVGARLGADALQTSVIAGIIGLALVLLFMAIFYRTMGIAADIALIIYVVLILIVVSGLRMTISLPSIAGLILSIGMATDANIVIFERIREEIVAGKTLRSAMRVGYKRALPAIIDSNITTLIAGSVLFWLGTGPIMGFAQMLIIGVLISVFTALIVTRVVTTCMMDLGFIKPSHLLSAKQKEQKEAMANSATPQSSRISQFDETAKPIVEKRKIYFIFSATIIAIGIAFMIFHQVRGIGFFNLDVEFSGGTSFTIDIGQEFNNSDIENIVRNITGESAPQVQQITNTHQVIIRTTQVDPDVRVALVSAISNYYELDAGAFTYSDVSPAVSAAMRRDAIMAIVVASLGMLLYISVRFRDIRTGASAVLAQVHDALVVLCIYAILRIPLNYAFIAVMLTTLGYSINATIIIFDRIRENNVRMPKVGYDSLINTSVTQTLRRTLFSTISSFIAVLMLYIIGVAAIRDFTLPIMVGLLFGAYSSVCLSGSAWFMMVKNKKRTAKI